MNPRVALFTVVAGWVLAGVQPAAAQSAQFFRVTGPTATTITGLDAEGLLVWSNAVPGATYTVQAAPVLPGGSNWVDYIRITPSSSGSSNRIIDLHPPAGMAFIPAGVFTMGDTFGEGDTNEVPLHLVDVSGFYLDKYEVTKAQWDYVYQWALTNGYRFSYVGSGKAANHPVQAIDWYDAVLWCNARSEQEGRIPAYYTDAGQTTVYRTGEVAVANSGVKWQAGYRLPTEAEWEKAARGGLSGQRFPWTDVDNNITHSRANYYSYSGYAYDTSQTRGYHPAFQTGGLPYTSPVGYFAPNGYGLYDMAGNVGEWCWDRYSGTYYSSSPSTDPRGPAAGSGRVFRGGSWGSYTKHCRTADRSYDFPRYYGSDLGFRCVLPPGR